ncbi:Crp/Fnr family transcriptional regulator [Mesorhizobium sp. M7A.F.Ca.US.011.01.1.1]|uniref:Crp/Fnr family transcriptional regulator n=1 Tax=unclassified Mesorhizobium TaxID=325217 RepID=UPI000FCA74CD|nr:MULTISPECIES: Crp/Fnr family transcriptional regulator [unclassified Mesorhizobium]RUW87657.1 Crp/Fnr family transcriptional regulator [Mesorhizobium sp. M7A.F.Ca.US.010.02.1.1]RUX28830.1 Crp/Fnr family transcriptional regulator [Mesorhizobium sp. M7A.F.Ca.US.011.01.1.1]
MEALPSVRALTPCDRCAVRRTSLCNRVNVDLQKELARLSHHRTYRLGETVLGEMEATSFVGIVVSGVLRMQKSLEDGRQQLVGLLFRSDFFGRVFGGLSDYDIEAASDVTLCCYERRAFERLTERFPELEHQLMLSTLNELDAARNWMLLLGCQTVPERVASFFLMLCRRSGANELTPDANLSIHVPISRRDMASYLGTTGETISRVIHEMCRKGIIKICNAQNFKILNKRQLVRMSGRDDLSSIPRTASRLKSW